MRPHTSSSAARLGTAALVSFAVLAAACSGGSDTGSEGATTDGTGSTVESDDTDADDSETTDAPVVRYKIPTVEQSVERVGFVVERNTVRNLNR